MLNTGFLQLHSTLCSALHGAFVPTMYLNDDTMLDHVIKQIRVKRQSNFLRPGPAWCCCSRRDHH